MAEQENTKVHTNFGMANILSFILTIIIAMVLGWVGYTYPPVRWDVPDEMKDINAMSPPADQARRAEMEHVNLWKNTLVKFGLAGLGIGIGGLIWELAMKRLGPAIVVLFSGMVFGTIGGALGLMVRKYLDLDYPIVLISQESRPLFADIVVFTIINTFLIMPFFILLRQHPAQRAKGKANGMLVAGLLAGLITPIAASMMISLGSTSQFPPFDRMITAIWFSAIALSAIMIFCISGSKPKPSLDSPA